MSTSYTVRENLKPSLDAKYRLELLDRLCELVRIPSPSGPEGGQEGELQALMIRQMRKLGARVRTFEPDDIPQFRSHPLCCGPNRNYANRPTVIGEIGPANAPALMILAHSDTVPLTAPENWTVDPFGAEIRDGKVYGLGVGDDKWGLATMLVILKAIQEAHRSLNKRLVFVSTIDEENGVCNGLLLLMLSGIQAQAALYLDGGNSNIHIGNLGGSSLYLRPIDPLPETRISDHARLLGKACQNLSRQRTGLFIDRYYQTNFVRESSVAYYLKQDLQGPYHQISFYTLPHEEKTATCRELEAVVAQTLGKDRDCYCHSYRQPWFEPALVPDSTPLIRHLNDACRDITGRESLITTISKNDAFVFDNHANIPTVMFGVSKTEGPGAYHQPDECIELSEAWSGCRIAYRAVCRWIEETP